MAESRDARAVVPFRHRHDGWTAARQARFLARLSETGCVREACRAAGLSKTSAYRAYARMPEFAAAWNKALATRRPMMEDAAFERGVNGVTVPVMRNGKVVAKRRRYSDGLLRFMIEREDKRDAAAAATRQGADALPPGKPTQAEVDASLLKRLNEAAERIERQERAKAIQFADRMRDEGKAP